MKNVPDTPLGQMYRDHIGMLLKQDLDGLLNQYTDDALLISSFMNQPVIYRGRAELREHFQALLGIGIQGLETEIGFWAETENPQTLMMTEQITMQSADGAAEMRFADSWVLQEGKIAIHFAGMVQHPDGSLA